MMNVRLCQIGIIPNMMLGGWNNIRDASWAM
jgi:hypothetical protein